MATSSLEDVLLQTPHVRYRKGDGTLFLMNERLAWMMDNRDTVCVSHKYADIKMQKVSARGKAKVQLQVTLHDGTSSTFQFVNGRGYDAQMKDQEEVKNLLQSLITKFKPEVNKELEEKHRLLSENPTLLQLYRHLVVSNIMDPEKFWSLESSKFVQKQQYDKQDVGVSGAFLVDIKPQPDGCNGFKYNLTADVIDSIFKTYPAVYKKYFEYVPQVLTERQFWTKFFQSHYFHRDRIHMNTKDIFTECAKEDEEELKKFANDEVSHIVQLQHKLMNDSYNTFRAVTDNMQSGNIVHQTIIKRFNQHSMMILRTHQQQSQKHSHPSTEAPPPKRMKVQHKISMNNFSGAEDAKSSLGFVLSVKPFHVGPLLNKHEDIPNKEELMVAAARAECEVRRWPPLRRHSQSQSMSLVNPTVAVHVLSELTPGGQLMKALRQQAQAGPIPERVQQNMKSLYVTLYELLHLFWANIPSATSEQGEDVFLMHHALRHFQTVQLNPFEAQLQDEFPHLRQQLTSHFNQLLNAAYTKFSTSQHRKSLLSL